MTKTQRIPATTDVLWIAHRLGDRCIDCDTEISPGMMLQMNGSLGVRCVRCAGYSGLVFVPVGDLALTRLATALSRCTVTLMQWSRRKGHAERKGTLVDPAARNAVIDKVESDAKTHAGDASYRPRFRVVRVLGEKLLVKA